MRRSIFAVAALLGSAGAAAAQEGAGSGSALAIARPAGQPHPWQMGLQEALSPIEAQIHWFSDYVLAFIVPIVILVAALLGYCIYRFRDSKNPVASRTSHNTLIEVIWTLAPVIVLLFIAVPSFQLLTAEYNPPSEPQLTVKATGHQWYWSYDYQPPGNSPEAKVKPVSFDSYPLAQLTDSIADQDAAAKAKGSLSEYPRLLAVDNEMVVPVNTVIRLTTTSGDVIHSWAMPSMGVKVDAIPGRLNEYWFEPLKEGLFYGQCSELCGQNHANMPIALRVVSKEQFQKWYAAASQDVGAANKQLMAQVDGAKTVAVAGR
ncbi:cytochrome c oxidase subunit II [Jiella sp. M17.18]|uniref:cytochrome c oxidase subunit II n=1 Tax=Jiella sp. M17.18 TaxID=3234247 RepID=UPI0034DFF481